jgi:proteasome alpha subunit
MLGDVFTHEIKPMEVEIVVAEVGPDAEGDRLFHILYDGTVVDEQGFTVLGGEADAIAMRLNETYEPGLSLDAALRAAVTALAGPGRTLTPAELEVAVLVRGNGRRAFRRLTDEETGAALAGGEVAVEPPPDEPAPADATGNEPEPSAEAPASAADEPEAPPDGT